MITTTDLAKANKGLSSIDVKGKDYVMVNSRISAFREICPDGSITTEIVPEMSGDGIVTMRSIVADGDGKVLASGMAQEKESSSYINKTSYIENCETSAVGRALGMLGIGIEDSIASAEELTNAITNQQSAANSKPSSREQLLHFCNQKGLVLEEIAKEFGVSKGMSEAEYAEALKKVKAKYAE